MMLLDARYCKAWKIATPSYYFPPLSVKTIKISASPLGAALIRTDLATAFHPTLTKRAAVSTALEKLTSHPKTRMID
ncbi:MAG: hypothetical protein GXP42_14470 [Chloroflexi bacterium]|nr:hypothetical protein [Chloroflexota bacterium]